MSSERTKAIDQALRQAELEARLAAEARSDDIKFAEFCFGSEMTGQPLVVEDGHYELMDAVNAHKRIVVQAAPRLGKTTFVTYARTIRRMGLDPLNYRVKIWSAKLDNATRHTLKIRNHVQNNRRIQLVFPNLVPGEKWTEAEWSVQRPPEGPGVTHPKEPTIWANGMEPSNQGFRSLEDIYDDIMDPVRSQSRYQCEKGAETIMDNVSRVEAGGKWIYLANTFRRWDIGFILAERYGWHLHMMPAVDERCRTLYPVLWTQKEVDDYPPARVDPDLKCKPRREGDSCFQEAYIQKCLALGEGRTTLPAVDARTFPDGVFTVTACDPAGGKKKKKSDLDAFVTLLVGPPGFFGVAGLGPGVRVALVIDVTAGKLASPEKRATLKDMHARYASTIMVEDVATQDWLRQELAVDAPHVPVAPFPTTAATKHHVDLGFESLATRMSLGLIIIPSYRDASGVLRVEDKIAPLLEDLRNYDPDAHTGDRAMALWIADVTARVTRLGAHIADSLDLSNRPAATAPSSAPAAFNPVVQHLRSLGVINGRPSPANQAAIDEEVRRRFGL